MLLLLDANVIYCGIVGRAAEAKDAYLLAAIEEHRPMCVLTFGNELLALGSHAGTQIVTPELFLSQLDSLR